MAKPNKITVQRRSDGNFEGVRPGAKRASVVGPTQGKVANASRNILRNDGGGELAIRGLNGKIREQDSVPKANDPRKSKG